MFFHRIMIFQNNQASLRSLGLFIFVLVQVKALYLHFSSLFNSNWLCWYGCVIGLQQFIVLLLPTLWPLVSVLQLCQDILINKVLISVNLFWLIKGKLKLRSWSIYLFSSYSPIGVLCAEGTWAFPVPQQWPTSKYCTIQCHIRWCSQLSSCIL